MRPALPRTALPRTGSPRTVHVVWMIVTLLLATTWRGSWSGGCGCAEGDSCVEGCCVVEALDSCCATELSCCAPGEPSDETPSGPLLVRGCSCDGLMVFTPNAPRLALVSCDWELPVAAYLECVEVLAPAGLCSRDGDVAVPPPRG